MHFWMDKRWAPDDLVKAIHSGRWQPPDALAQQCAGGLQAAHLGSWVVAAPVRSAPQPAAVPGAARVSPRQRQVLRGLAAGLTTGQIAHRLGVAVSTVNKNVRKLKNQLGADTRAALVRQADSEGLLD